MFKTFAVLFVFVFYSAIGSAQKNDSAEALLEYPNSIPKATTRGRRVLLERFNSNDSSSVSKILNYLTLKVEDAENLAIFPDEYCLYQYWLGNYDSVMSFTGRFNADYINQLQNKKLPVSGNMQKKLVESLRLQRNNIYDKILSTNTLQEADKRFLKLNFDQLLSWGDGKDSAVDSINLRVKSFLADYPESNHKSYVNNFIGVVFKNRKLSFSAEYFLGFGLFDGNIGKAMNQVIPLGLSFEARYHRVVLKFIGSIGLSSTKDSINNNKATWQKNAAARVVIPGVNFGFYIIDGKYIKVSPFAGVGLTSIGPPAFEADKPENKNVGFDFSPTISYGFCADIFIKPKKDPDFNLRNRDLHYLRLTYTSYQPSLDRKYPGYSGNIQCVTIGYVLRTNPRRRVK